MLRTLVCLIFALGLFGCSSIPSDIDPLEAKVSNVKLTKPTLTDAILLFTVNVKNPNSFPLDIEKISYNLKLNEQDFVKGSLDKGVKIAASGDSSLEIPIPITYEDVYNSARQFSNSSVTNYTLEGRVHSGLFSVPLKKTGEVRLPDASSLLQ